MAPGEVAPGTAAIHTTAVTAILTAAAGVATPMAVTAILTAAGVAIRPGVVIRHTRNRSHRQHRHRLKNRLASAQ